MTTRSSKRYDHLRRSLRGAPLAAAGLLGATTSLLVADAHAAGFATARFGGELGHPMTSNPTAIYYNPAGIALSRGVTIFADGTLAFRSLSYERKPDANAPGEVPEPADGIGANTGKATLNNQIAAPMIGATYALPLTEKLDVAGGLAMMVPFGGSATWDKNEAFKGHPNYPGPYDGRQRYYTIHGSIRSLYLSAAAAASYGNLLSVGVSGGVSLNSIDSVRARSAAIDTNLDTEGRAWLKAKNVTPQLGVGVMLTPLEDRDKLRVGISYQAPPGFGSMKLRGLLQKYFAGNLSGNVAGTDDVELHQTLPDIVRAGVSFRPTNRIELRLMGDYTRWSLFQDQCINNAGEPCEVSHGDDGLKDGQPKPGSENATVVLPRRFRDTVSGRIGASFFVRPGAEVFGGLGIDQHAIPDATVEPSMVDFNSVSLAVGGRYRISRHIAAAATYTQFIYAPRDTTGQSKMPYYAAPSNSPDSGGLYRQSIGVLDVNLQLNFDPAREQIEISERRAAAPAVL
ncbi:MAG: outer membrane protein transport protein [Deltaproteobacteria bacterium]|nr:outer membrane protein transport protein [Deltaproteobacteria bacterium]